MATHDPSFQSEKAALRRLARARRDAIPGDQRAAAATAAATHVDSHVFAALPAGATIGLYASMRSELPGAALATAAAARGLALAYPRTAADHELVFHRAASADLLIGRFGIPEPQPDAPVVAVDELAVVIVPGLLFDRGGFRLGWGGGWYDALLPRTPALRVGFCLDVQRVDDVPRAAHDQPVHVVITERGVHLALDDHGDPRWTP